MTSPIPLLALRRGVVLPCERLRIPVGRPRSVALARAVGRGDAIVVATQLSQDTRQPGLDDLEPYAVLAKVTSTTFPRRGPVLIQIEALRRVALSDVMGDGPLDMALADAVDEPPAGDEPPSISAAADQLADTIAAMEPDAEDSLGEALTAWRADPHPSRFADRVAAALDLSQDIRLELLGTVDVERRLARVAELAADSAARSDVDRSIDRQVRKELYEHQRQAVLREQLKAIQKELGADADADAVDTLAARVAEAELSDEARRVAERELSRLRSLPQQGAEHHVVRAYLEAILELPWKARAQTEIDVESLAAMLDADHYGLDDVKKRILEHLAVLKLAGTKKGAILALTGPPGVGKTSLGQSIADGLGRPLVRIALGGVRDEAEIRGHRRTYVGALPGRIINGLKKAKVSNPVVLLDEIDKLGQGWQGSPEAALLEVLDPEQNSHFTDHYMEIPFDLSEVLFICTANRLDTLSAPLLDRLEVVELSGYTRQDKRHIATNHLLSKQLVDHGLGDGALTIPDATLNAIIGGYTREAGVRQLNRQLERLCRAVTLEVARATEAGGWEEAPLTIGVEDLPRYIGKERFFDQVAERAHVAGVATGLAWTPVGGDILFVETSRMAGKGGLQITGQLGDVMTESAQAAMTYIRSHSEELGIEPRAFETHDVHIHVPAGAVPKDGPSAGVTMFTALASLFSELQVRSDTAMTGECTLRGRVLPVGGIKSKVLAAHRSGIKRVILPEKNRRDLDDVPSTVQEAMEFIFASEMRQVLDAALTEPGAGFDHVGSTGAEHSVPH